MELTDTFTAIVTTSSKGLFLGGIRQGLASSRYLEFGISDQKHESVRRVKSAGNRYAFFEI